MYDLAIIGLGPAGLEAFNIAVKNNLKTIVFDDNPPGGTCLNLGCIPTKAIMHCANFFDEIKNSSKLGIKCENYSYNWSEILNRKNDIVSKFTKPLNTFIEKNATYIKSKAEIILNDKCAQIFCDNNTYEAKNIIIATGSKPKELKGLKFDKNFILSSDDIYNLSQLPKSIVIVGSGAIGLEWAMIFKNLDVDVTIIEKAPFIAPLFDCDIQKRIERVLKLKNIKFFKNDYIISINNGLITLNSGVQLSPDKILCAVGREVVMPNIKIQGCKKLEDFNNIFIIGDAKNQVMLAHNASDHASQIMDKILYDKDFEQKQIPSVIYMTPEVASVGLKEQDIENKQDYKINTTLISSIAKSWCDESSFGFIKVIIKNNEILGAHMVCKNASDLISIFEVLIEQKINVDSVQKMIFPHPSYSEAIKEVLKID